MSHPWRRFLPPMPREHGSWAAVLMPLLAAAAVLGVNQPALRLSGVAAAAFFVRAAWHALPDPARRGRALGWLGIWIAVAVLLTWPLAAAPWAPAVAAIGAAGIGAEILLTALGRKGGWRSLVGDLAGAVVSTLLVPAYALALRGTLNLDVRLITLITFLFWVCSTVRVRSQLRERGNQRFRRLTLLIHLAALAVAAALAGRLAGVLVPAALHAAWLYWRRARAESALRIGIREIAHSVGFVALMALLGRQ